MELKGDEYIDQNIYLEVMGFVYTRLYIGGEGKDILVEYIWR